MRKVKIILTLFSFLLLVHTKVSASEIEVSNPSFEISYTEESTLNVIQSADIKNILDDNVVSLIRFDFPFEILNVEAYIDNVWVNTKYGARGVSIEIDPSIIQLSNNSKVVLKYDTQGVLYSNGPVKRIYWPEFMGRMWNSEYGVKFILPQEWGDISYASEGYSVTGSNGIKEITFNTKSKVLFTLGRPISSEISASWSIDKNSLGGESVRIPLPYDSSRNFIFNELVNIKRGYRDQFQNEFIVLNPLQDRDLSGSYSGVFNIPKLEIENPTKNSNFFSGLEELDIDTKEDVGGIYQTLLDRFDPQKEESIVKRIDIEESTAKEKQNALDYSNALAGALRKKGVDAEIVYGIADFPVINKQDWHFWVVYVDENNKWVDIDPFMGDLYKLDFFNNITPSRTIWGIIGQEEDVSTLGLNLLHRDKSIVNFKDEEVEDSVGFNYEVLFDLPNVKLTGLFLPAQVIIRNNAMKILSLDEIKVRNISLDKEELNEYLIIPNSFEIIDIGSVLIFEPYIRKKPVVEGNIKVSYVDAIEDYSFSKEFEIFIQYGGMGKILISTFLISIAVIFVKTRFKKNKR